MARSSTRKSAAKARDAFKKVRKDDDEEEEMKESSEEEEYVRAPPKKQAKTSRSSTGKRNAQKGAMSGFMLLPLEVVTQICESLDLKTLFHLSILNRRFFGFLRDDSLSHLWEDARETSGLPDLEAPMPPHQLAHLLFGSHCSSCGKSTTVVDYFLRIRACKACSEKDEESIYSYESYDFAPYSARDSRGRKRGKRLQRVDELEHLDSHFSSFNDERAYARQNLESGDEWEEPNLDFGCTHPLCKDMGEVTEEGMRDHYRTMRQARSNDGDALVEWQLERAAEVEAERQGVIEKRCKDIAERFKALGWHPHYFDKPEFAAHPLVAVAKELDHATWMNIRSPLETFLEASRAAEDEECMEKTRSARIADRKAEFLELATDKTKLKALRLYPVPKWAEFAELDAVKSLFLVDTIEAVYATAPTIVDPADAIATELDAVRTTLKRELFDKLLVQLREAESTLPVPSDAGETRASEGDLDATSALMLPTAAGTDGNYTDEQMDDIFSRAYSIFQCDHCHMLDSYPRILSHSCKVYRYSGHWDEAQRPSFQPSKYVVDLSKVVTVVAMIDLAGLPRSVKASAMDGLGATFSCLCERESVAQTWLQLLRHMSVFYCRHDNPMSTIVHESLAESKERVFAKHLAAAEREFGERGDAV